MSIAIGIDLGTTNSVMAIVQGNVRALQNSQIEYLTKSVVGFYKEQIIVGSNALDKMAQDPKNLIISIKRLMGRAFSDPEVQKVVKHHVYEIKPPTEESNDDIRVKLGSKEYSPIEISAMILKKIKEDAEERLKDKVEYVTITVPAYFNDKQREATRLAGLMAGFKVQVLLDEPTAAAVAFSVDQVKEDEARNIVVYDLGGGTFDVSVLTIAGGVCARLNTEGDMWLGGDDFDYKIMDYVFEKVKEEYNLDAKENKRFVMELKKKAEKAKIQLSNMRKTDINVPGLLQDSKGNLIDIEIELTSDQFEKMIETEVKKSIDIVKKALVFEGLSDDQIDNILLVGGSSTIPMIQRALRDTFGEEKILKNVDPMLCVAYGAAIIANRIGENVKCPNCNTSNDGNNHVCTTCGKILDKDFGLAMGTNMPYGIQTEGDIFTVIIPKNSPYPMQKYLIKEFEVPRPNLRRIKIPVYAGVEENASNNSLQFTVWLPLPKGTPEGTKLDVGFLVNDNGLVSSVKLRLKDGSGIEKEVFINKNLGLDAERGKIENKINEIKQKIDQNKGDLGISLYNELDAEYQNVIDAIESNKLEEAEQKVKEVEEKIKNNLIVNEPEWIIRAENLIGWAEIALAKFGGLMEPDITYRIKTSIEDLKTAIKNNEEEKADEKFTELDKVTEQIPPFVFVLMRLTMNSFIASNMGRKDLSDKLDNLIAEIEDALKVGVADINLLEEKLKQGMQIINQIEGEGSSEFEKTIDEDVLRHEKKYRSSH